jgi:predicted dehydrogenase
MNVLIVGLGSIAKKHITALTSLNTDFRIYALRSGFEVENNGKIINVLSLNDLNDRMDFAIISNPTSLHFETIELLMNKSIPLFIEKPPVHTLNGTEKLIAEIQNKVIITYVACNLRFHPCIKFLKNYIHQNQPIVNEVNVYCGSYLPDWRPGKDYTKVYSANAEMGGGVNLDLFHEIDYARWIFGAPDAFTGFFSNKSALNITATDYANYLLSYPAFNISIILNYFRRKGKRTIEILFDNDTWIVDLIANRIVSESGNMIFESAGYEPINSYQEQMKYFVDCLIYNEQPMNSFRESIETLKITLKNEPIRE